jgi:hypothetical protein
VARRNLDIPILNKGKVGIMAHSGILAECSNGEFALIDYHENGKVRVEKIKDIDI